MITVRQSTVAFRTSRRECQADPIVRDVPEPNCLEVQPVFSKPQVDNAAFAYPADTVRHCRHGGIEAIDSAFDAFSNNGRRHQGRIDGQVRHVMAGLWIHDRDRTQFEARVFKDAATHSNVRLTFGQATGLQLCEGIKAQQRRWCRIRSGRSRVGHAARVYDNFGYLVGFANIVIRKES